MGLNFQQHDFTDAQRALFDQRVQAQLCEVKHEISRDCYNRDEVSLGAELEFYLVNRQFNPAPIVEAVLDKARIEGLQEELNQCNRNALFAASATVRQSQSGSRPNRQPVRWPGYGNWDFTYPYW